VADQKEGEKIAKSNADDSKWDHFVLDHQTVCELVGLSQPGAAGPKWPAAQILCGKPGFAVYQATVELTEEMIKGGRTILVFNQITDRGAVFVNGKSVGKNNDDGASFSADVAAKLKAGKNKIAIVVNNKDKQEAAGLTKEVQLVDKEIKGIDLAWELAPKISGDAANWQSDKTPTGDWTAVDLDATYKLPKKGALTPIGKAESLATWYRMEFKLPEKTPGVWVPWKAIMEASGNGPVYLNGHPIGLYWEIGLQREYFLPECWLNFGPDKTNVLVICLRSTEKGAEVRATEIAPYKEFAEERK
jgi:hypothetical protein